MQLTESKDLDHSAWAEYKIFLSETALTYIEIAKTGLLVKMSLQSK